MERKRIFAISGVKNSGKTTLICRLLEIFKDKGLKVAVLKHDGHDFVPDVPGTDTYCQLQSGAYGTAVFSAGKYMLVKQQPQISEKELAEFFPEADLILLEGFKYSTYPKIEIIRKGNYGRKCLQSGKTDGDRHKPGCRGKRCTVCTGKCSIL